MVPFIALVLSHRARADNVEPLLIQLNRAGIKARVRLGIAWPPTRLDALIGLYQMLDQLPPEVGALVLEDDALVNTATLPPFLRDAATHQLLTTFCTISDRWVHPDRLPPRGAGQLVRMQGIRSGIGYTGSTALYLPPQVAAALRSTPGSFLPEVKGNKVPLAAWLAARADQRWGGMWAALPNPIGHAPGESLINPGTASRESTTFGLPMDDYRPVAPRRGRLTPA